MLPILLVVLLLAGGLPARAQMLWQRAYGRATTNDYCDALLPLRAGGYLIVGHQETPARVFLIRTNTQGDTLWTRYHAVPGFNILYPYNACEDNAGRVLICGTGVMRNNTTDTDAFLLLVNTNSRGDSLWTRRTIGPTNDDYNNVALDANNNFFVTGDIVTQCMMMQISAAGQVLRQTNTSFCAQALVKVPGGLWLAAPSYSPANSKFYFVDDAGTIVRSKPCPANFESFYSLTLVEPGYILGCGGRLAKFDLNMDTVWTRQLRYYQLQPTARLARLTPDNHYAVLGECTVARAPELTVHKVGRQGQVVRDTLLQRGARTLPGGLAVDAASGAYLVAASAEQGPIGRTDIGLLALRPWAAVATAVRAPQRPAAGPLAAWPNPAAGAWVTVRPPRPAAGTAELRDLTGRVLRRWPAAPAAGAERQLPLADVAPGLYLLTVRDAAGRSYTARLLRE